MLHVRNLQIHAFSHYFFSFKNCFLLGLIFTHAIKFGLMLDHGVFSVHAKFHRHLAQGQITCQNHACAHFFFSLNNCLELSLFSCACYQIWMDVGSYCC